MNIPSSITAAVVVNTVSGEIARIFTYGDKSQQYKSRGQAKHQALLSVPLHSYGLYSVKLCELKITVLEGEEVC
jgi:hypothetical protein